MRGSLLAVGVGLCCGVPAALAWRVARTMLFGVTPEDVGTFVSAGFVLPGVALIAAWIPARRGAAVQPTQALRYE
ncbi:MAG TPA: hypothetical protein VKE70_22265 [Candidatus Solibacter sp.]|nr:hypothetical protein [Candidatus Solibacter sp.]